MDRVDVNGRRIAFRAAGTGPPVLLLHGAQADSRDWQYQFDAYALGLTRVHLVGLSLGSIIAIAFSARHPSSVTSLVLASAYAGWAGSLPAAEVERRVNLVRQEIDRPGVDAARSLAATLLPADSARWMVEAQIAMISQSRPATTRAMVTNIAVVDLRPLLSRIRAPTMLL